MRRAVTILVAMAALAVPASALAGPVYDIHASWADSNLPPGGQGQFLVQARNIGDAVGADVLTITELLPEGVSATAVRFGGESSGLNSQCAVTLGARQVKCTLSAAQLPTFAGPPGNEKGSFGVQPSGFLPPLTIDVAIHPAAKGEGTNTATVAGGGGPAAASETRPVRFDPTPAPFGPVPGSLAIDGFDGTYPAGAPLRQAGAHPAELRVGLTFATKTGIVEGQLRTQAKGRIKTLEATLPRGFVGNPEATPKCDPVQFAEAGSSPSSTGCPPDTQVGSLNLNLVGSSGEFTRVALYNLKPPKGQVADFAFNAAGLVQAHIYGTPDPAHDYAIKSVTPNITNLIGVLDAEATLWGVPADPAHDMFRAWRDESQAGPLGAPWGSAPIRPFLTAPSDCGFENGGALVRIDSYNHPGEFSAPLEYPDPMNVEGCGDPRFHFGPKISLQPTDRHAGAPTGLEVNLEVPQRNDEVTNATDLYAQKQNVKAIATPPIKKAVVTLPEGMTLSPSAAQGLGSCSLAQIGLGTDKPVECPDNSQYGTLTLHTPLLPVDAQPQGFIYIARQNENPFHEFLALYLVIEDPERGILVKIPGRIRLDPDTGQISTTFDNLPQLPVSNMQLQLNGGVRAGLVNSSTCGTKTIRAELFSWHDPGAAQVVESSFDVTQKSDGSPCVGSLGERPFGPQLQAGSTNPLAGEYSPFVFRLTRTDDDQEFSQLGVTLPTGLAAKFAGLGQCSDAAIARAEARTGPGEGVSEQTAPSCPASSFVGSTTVGVGVGVPLTYVPGKVYLAGPYRGAPLSMVVISPAVVGPYDLGVIAVRTALHVNPETAQGQAISDPFPQIFQGIPVRIRDIRLNLDRPGFTLNPTSCAEKQITAHITGTGGNVRSTADDTAADLTNRFQVAECASLDFKPKLSIHLFGGTKRGAHPRLSATVTYPKRGAYANIAAASVALPSSEFLDQSHIKTVCTRVQFAAHQCPAGSVYGQATARSPLFDFPLEGPVYLRSSSHPLPDLVVTLRGPDHLPVEVNLAGRVDTVNGGIRNTFALVPDAPVESFTLTMRGGKKGLLENSRDLCASTNRVTAKLTAQNGRRLTLRPALKSSSCKKAKGRKGQRAR